jgi:hypothetical protein
LFSSAWQNVRWIRRNPKKRILLHDGSAVLAELDAGEEFRFPEKLPVYYKYVLPFFVVIPAAIAPGETPWVEYEKFSQGERPGRCAIDRTGMMAKPEAMGRAWSLLAFFHRFPTSASGPCPKARRIGAAGVSTKRRCRKE